MPTDFQRGGAARVAGSRDANNRLAPGAMSGWLAAALDELDYGIVITAADRRVRHLNHRARIDLAADDHPVQLARGDLSGRDEIDHRNLSAAVLDAGWRGRRCLLRLGAAKRAIVAVVPLPEDGVAVLMPALRGGDTLAIQWFARWHHLTPAEQRVLAELSEGARPADIARRHSVSLSTVRTQVGRIRQKTRAPDVGALLRQIWGLPPLVGALRHTG